MEQKLASNKTRLNFLDFYKGICILFVIFTHNEWTQEQRLYGLFPFWIGMAVPVFMVITGYVSAMSFQTHAHNLKNAYRPTEILRKWLRFVVPFLPIYAFQVVWSYAVLQKSFSKYTLVKFFLEGGDGPGSYYFPVMLQMVVIIPIVCAVIKRFRRKGLIGFFAANVLFEIGKTYGGMNPLTYRLCAAVSLYSGFRRVSLLSETGR